MEICSELGLSRGWLLVVRINGKIESSFFPHWGNGLVGGISGSAISWSSGKTKM